jgi:hypothetical protein
VNGTKGVVISGLNQDQAQIRIPGPKSTPGA